MPIPKVIESLLENPKLHEAIEAFYLHKKEKKNLSKLAEEAGELSVKILQKLNDKTKVNPNDILEEIIDVQMNILIILKYYKDDKDSQNLVNEKIKKFFNTKKYKKYIEIHKTFLNENKG